MTARKQPLSRTPAYVSRAVLAGELCMAESTVDELVKKGVIPRPIHISQGCVRWDWDAVCAALASLGTGTDTCPQVDPCLEGARRVTQITERRRRVPS